MDKPTEPINRFAGVELGVHCAICKHPIIRGATPYELIDGLYYHKWCLDGDVPPELRETQK